MYSTSGMLLLSVINDFSLFSLPFLRFSVYSTRYDQRPGAGNAFIISDDITTCRVPKKTLFVIFRTYPCKAEAVGTLDYCFIADVKLENLTRDDAERENGENKQPEFARYWHFLLSYKTFPNTRCILKGRSSVWN